MSKKLSEMSLEELWQLFPIFLTEHQDYWKDWCAEEKTLLKPLLPQTLFGQSPLLIFLSKCKENVIYLISKIY